MSKQELKESTKLYMKQLYQRKVIGEAEELEALLDIFFNYIDLCVEEHYRDEHSVE